MPSRANDRPHPFGLSLLFGLLYFIQGVTDPTDGLIVQPVMSLLKSWGQQPVAMATFAAVLTVPWGLKPLYGLLSDLIPLAGYYRKSYLVAASGLTATSLGWLAFYALPSNAAGMLLLLLLPATVGVAFCDVVIDALMVEKGQPHGWTGRLQAVQWAALYGAMILTGWVGGYLTHHGQQQVAFLICAGLTLLMLIVALVAIWEPRAAQLNRDPGTTLQVLRDALRSRAILAVAAFLFLWNFNPFSTTVLYLHMTKVLGFSETFYGLTRSIEAAALAVGSLAYAFYCRRVPMRSLVHVSIVLGIVSTLGYWLLAGQVSAEWIAVGAGLATATATMIQLDLAAQVCPPRVAGTLFALMMGLANMGILLSTWLGGWCYERGAEWWGEAVGFNLLVALGALCTAACWLVAPQLRPAIGASTFAASDASVDA